MRTGLQNPRQASRSELERRQTTGRTPSGGGGTIPFQIFPPALCSECLFFFFSDLTPLRPLRGNVFNEGNFHTTGSPPPFLGYQSYRSSSHVSISPSALPPSICETHLFKQGPVFTTEVILTNGGPPPNDRGGHMLLQHEIE